MGLAAHQQGALVSCGELTKKRKIFKRINIIYDMISMKNSYTMSEVASRRQEGENMKYNV